MNQTPVDAQFGELLEPHRRELRVHCYRMMGSVEDAEDMVQETFLRAWKRRETFEGRASLRAWLYRIATNACLDILRQRSRRMIPRTYQPVSTVDEPIPADVNEPIWLQPYPSELLSSDDDPQAQVAEREAISLAFVTLLQLLPPRQRAILLLRDVLDWKAQEVAALLDTTEAAVKSGLHRARNTLANHQQQMPQAIAQGDVHPAQVDDYVAAWHQADVDALLRLLTEDATFSMPPIPAWYRGHDQLRSLTSKTVFGGEARGRWHLLPTRANHQSAFGLYRKGQGGYEFYGIQVLTFHESLIADIITFRHTGLHAYFNLPGILP